MAKKLFIVCSFVLFLFLFFKSAEAAGSQLYIPFLKIQTGHSVKVPVKISQVNKLAGIKLVIKYDSNLLKYKNVHKTEKTSSLMHVVNDQKPGKLIIVMAGAKGISGIDFEIVTIQFKTVSGLKKKVSTKIQISEANLVAEDLKEIQYQVIENALIIYPEE